MAKNIVLTGFMMAGKTQIGKYLAELTGRRLVDSDEEIVGRAGVSINEIFEKYGEEYFRGLESTIIKELADEENIIISTGGGAVLREENIAVLRKRGVIVNLKITPRVIEERLEAERAARPLIKNAELGEVLNRLNYRLQFYSNCDYCLEVSNEKSPLEHAQEILDMLTRNGEI